MTNIIEFPVRTGATQAELDFLVSVQDALISHLHRAKDGDTDGADYLAALFALAVYELLANVTESGALEHQRAMELISSVIITAKDGATGRYSPFHHVIHAGGYHLEALLAHPAAIALARALMHAGGAMQPDGAAQP